jgi:hypothetical protein
MLAGRCTQGLRPKQYDQRPLHPLSPRLRVVHRRWRIRLVLAVINQSWVQNPIAVDTREKN